MSIVGTTLSAAITASQTVFGVASATNINNPVYLPNLSVTRLLIEQELMEVISVVGTQVTVRRGIEGTQALAHSASVPVLSGQVSLATNDFPVFTPTRTVDQDAPLSRFGPAPSAPVASATTITPSGALFHVTGTTAIATINLPANFIEGQITIIFDGICTWTAAGNIAVAGTTTSAGASVTFTYDAKTGKWYPSRLA